MRRCVLAGSHEVRHECNATVIFRQPDGIYSILVRYVMLRGERHTEQEEKIVWWCVCVYK